MGARKNERGAVAVEMAIVLPLLLLLVIGIMEFGRVLNVQISLTHAAREGARHAAIHYDDPMLDVTATALAASPSLSGLAVTVDDNAGVCSTTTDGEVTVTTRVTLSSMSGYLEPLGLFPIELTGEGVMRCGG